MYICICSMLLARRIVYMYVHVYVFQSVFSLSYVLRVLNYLFLFCSCIMSVHVSSLGRYSRSHAAQLPRLLWCSVGSLFQYHQ